MTLVSCHNSISCGRGELVVQLHLQKFNMLHIELFATYIYVYVHRAYAKIFSMLSP